MKEYPTTTIELEYYRVGVLILVVIVILMKKYLTTKVLYLLGSRYI